MTALDAAHRYFDAWNARDAEAVIASLTDRGTYEDPIIGGPIAGDALRGYVQALWGAFPDLRFELKSVAETGNGRIAAEWIMRGTNHGSFQGLPPTGKIIESAGADFIDTEGGKVSSVVGYFDSRAVPAQLGLQVLVQPAEIGPFRFGTSTAAQTGNDAVPGAFSITQLHAVDDDAALEVAGYSRQIMTEMLGMPGFIGAVTAVLGKRMVTVSAWTDSEAPASFMRQGTHAKAMKPFFDGSLATSGYTSAWSPDRINPYRVRCDACDSMQAPGDGGWRCECGADLPSRPAYW